MMTLEPSRFLTRRYLNLDQVALHASSEAEGFGVANLLDDARSQVWRATSTDAAHVDLDLGQALPVNCLAVVNHNLSYKGRITISAGAAQGGAERLAIEEDAWECLWGADECAADEHGADGYPSNEERARYFPAGSLRLIYLAELVSARWWRVGLVGPTWADEYNPAGLIQAGAIIPGFYFRSDRRVCAPLAAGPGSETKLEYSDGGQHWRAEGPHYRGGKYKFEQLDAGQAVGSWWDLLQEVDVGLSFVADFFPGAASQVLRLRHQIYCHQPKSQGQPISLDRMTRGALTLEVRESY